MDFKGALWATEESQVQWMGKPDALKETPTLMLNLLSA